MKRKSIYLVTMLVLCCLMLTACSAKTLNFDLKTLKDAALYPGLQMGMTYEEVVKAGIPLEKQAASEGDFAGKPSQTFKAAHQPGKAAVNGEALRETSFQFLDGALLNVSLFPTQAKAETLRKILTDALGEPEETPTAQPAVTQFVWQFEAKGHSLTLTLLAAQKDGETYCSSLQLIAADLLPSGD